MLPIYPAASKRQLHCHTCEGHIGGTFSSYGWQVSLTPVAANSILRILAKRLGTVFVWGIGGVGGGTLVRSSGRRPACARRGPIGCSDQVRILHCGDGRGSSSGRRTN